MLEVATEYLRMSWPMFVAGVVVGAVLGVIVGALI